jgi:[acyl-carrier-protein] S-malonyltransferase
VTPAKGLFTRAEGVDEGGDVARGIRLGTIRTNRDEHAIVSPETGVLAEWLRHDGDIVATGLPVVRIQSGADYR